MVTCLSCESCKNHAQWSIRNSLYITNSCHAHKPFLRILCNRIPNNQIEKFILLANFYLYQVGQDQGKNMTTLNFLKSRAGFESSVTLPHILRAARELCGCPNENPGGMPVFFIPPGPRWKTCWSSLPPFLPRVSGTGAPRPILGGSRRNEYRFNGSPAQLSNSDTLS